MTKHREEEPLEVVQAHYREALSKKRDEMAHLIEANGQFDSIPLHLKSGPVELTDKDVTKLMPSSAGNIEVLAAIHLSSTKSSIPVLDQVINSFVNRDIGHIVLPVGPGHWRGVHISKPTEDNPNYHVEVSDSMGVDSAQRINGLIKEIFSSQGIENYEVEYAAPKVPQKDAYSCGDFMCSYAHKKVQALAPDAGNTSLKMIEAYDTANGNADAGLRGQIKKIDSSLAAGEQIDAGGTYVPLPMDETTVTVRASVIAKLSAPLEMASEYDKNLLETNAPDYGEKGQDALKTLINAREVLFAQRKSGAAVEDADHALALQLQCEEFENAKFTP